MSWEEASLALRAALRSADGAYPEPETLALALAKTALETGRWQSIWNGNFGNVKAGETYAGNFTCITLNEVIGGKVVWFAPEGQLAAAPRPGMTNSIVGQRYVVPDGHPQTRMRAYANRFDGAGQYVDFLSKLPRYAKAWQRLLAGDPVGFVHELAAARYFTADETTYRNTVVKLHAEFLGKLRGLHVEEVHKTDEEWQALRATVIGNRFAEDQKAIDSARLEEMAGLGMASTRDTLPDAPKS
jgi:hypothetical protein